MHVHADYSQEMRTTIELDDTLRGRLLDLAARRGVKGFSSIVQEALDQYFALEDRRQGTVDRALSALGSLSDEEADRLEDEVRSLRRSWR